MNSSFRVLSCIQPTGTVHIGNYFGSISNWLQLQDQYQCSFGIANYHAMTMPFQPGTLHQSTTDLVLSLVACGIRAENIFIQSLVPERLELSWILSCLTSHDDVFEVFQNKRAQAKDDFSPSVGLLQFPLLQSSDILLHRANLIPIGRDLKGHLDKVREIARRFNERFSVGYFAEPEPLYTETPELKSILDPARKMSKSYGRDHCISIFDKPDVIRLKIENALSTVSKQNESHHFRNLRDIREVLVGDGMSDSLGLGELKESVILELGKWTAGRRDRRADLEPSSGELMNAVRAQSAILRREAQGTLCEIKEIVGLL